MGATDQPRYNGFRVIRDGVITALQCSMLTDHLFDHISDNIRQVCLNIYFQLVVNITN